MLTRRRRSLLSSVLAVFALTLVVASTSPRAQSQAPAAVRVTAITGATLIDGTGGAAMADAVVVVTGDRISAVGPRASTPVPPGAPGIGPSRPGGRGG